ncbi:MAG: hypothetical protein WC777_00650 [Candidatus Gracilibacteria bacterium]
MNSKNSVLILSLGTFLALGFLSSNFLFKNRAIPVTNEPPTTVSFHALSIARDLDLYTQSASLIVIGRVTKVGEPYLEDQGLGSRQEVELELSEVLKGDRSMTTVNVLVRGYEIVEVDGDEATIIPGNEPPLFVAGEYVLLFLGTTSQGEYVSFAGPYGKYLIDNELNVSSSGDFSMSLEELKEKINAVLQSQPF